MTDYFKGLSDEERESLNKSSFPDWVSPMLATLTDDRFSKSDWIYECKYDGERALTLVHNGKVTILSRNKLYLNNTYPDLVEAYTHKDSFILDGEIVALDKGVSSFSKLQQRIGVREMPLEEARKSPVYYYIFDILYLNGYDLRDLPLRARRNILEKVVSFKDPLRFSEGILKEGVKYYESSCKKGWEGVIAKRLDAPYQGKRSRDWLKFKCSRSQELVIIGYTEPHGSREHFGALLVGYYEGKELKYAGKVGTGFTEKTLSLLKKKMDQHKSPESPVTEKIREPRKITWLNPALVGEFDFTEWTNDGKLRHPRYKGLREDKAASEVIREKPK